METISFLDLPRKCIEWITMVFLLITMLLDIGTPTATNGLELTNEKKLVLTDAMYAGQGITTDGEYYYTAGSMTGFNSNGLAKWDIATFDKVLVNYGAIPEDLNKEHKSNYIGGISYYDGLIYAAVKNEGSDYPLVITFDSYNLKPVDIYEMPAELFPGGIPWVAVDAEKGYLYTSKFTGIKEIYVFDLETMEYSHSLELSQNLTRIQGGEVYDGILYLSYDVSQSTKDQLISVDVETGAVKVLSTRDLPALAGNGAEDLTVYPFEDGSLIHVIDYDKTVATYIRDYKIVE